MDYTPEQQVAYETMIADRYDVDPTYFAEKYSMPVGQRRQAAPTLPASDSNDDSPTRGNDSNGQSKEEPQNNSSQSSTSAAENVTNNAHRFFI